MFEKSDNPLLNRELCQEIPLKKLPFTLHFSGRDVEVRAEYKIEMERVVGTCGECGKENVKIFREKVISDPVIESSDPEVVEVAREKIRELVEGVEDRMSCCDGCFSEEFKRKRPEMYIRAMEEVSKRLGISIDMSELREVVLRKKADQ